MEKHTREALGKAHHYGHGLKEEETDGSAHIELARNLG